VEKDNGLIALTPNFYQLGTPDYPAYLSLGEYGMIIEGGISVTFPTIVRQIETLGIDPHRIKYLVITHTHPDHIGAVPRLRKLWPHLRVVASPMAAKILQSEETIKEFIRLDSTITEILMIRDDIAEWPTEFENPSFEVDMVVKEGDRLDLGAGISWTVYDTPGHSPCQIALYNESEAILDMADAAGLYQPDRDCFWPNYFYSLEAYCKSISKLYTLPAKIGAHGHGGVVRGDVRHHLQRAMEATESYHRGIIARLSDGEDPTRVSLDMAKEVFTFTHLQPFQSILGLTKLMMKRSQATGDRADLFTIP